MELNLPDTSIYSRSTFFRFLGILRRGGRLVGQPGVIGRMPPRDMELAYQVLAEEGNTFRWDKSCPDGTLLAYLSGWDDCSEVVLRLPKAENVPSYPETPPEAATRRETDQNQGSGDPLWSELTRLGLTDVPK